MGDTWRGEYHIRRRTFGQQILICVYVQEFGATAKTAPAGFQIKTVSTGTERGEILRQKDTALGTVVENRVLTAPGAPVKRHIGQS